MRDLALSLCELDFPSLLRPTLGAKSGASHVTRLFRMFRALTVDVWCSLLDREGRLVDVQSCVGLSETYQSLRLSVAVFLHKAWAALEKAWKVARRCLNAVGVADFHLHKWEAWSITSSIHWVATAQTHHLLHPHRFLDLADAVTYRQGEREYSSTIVPLSYSASRVQGYSAKDNPLYTANDYYD